MTSSLASARRRFQRRFWSLMVEFSLFRNDGAALYRPVAVRKRSYLSITEGISEEQLTEALKNFFKGRVRNYKRIALTLLQNLKTKNRKCAKKCFYLSTKRTTRSSWSATASMASFSSLTFCPPPMEWPTSPPFQASPIPNTCNGARRRLTWTRTCEKVPHKPRRIYVFRNKRKRCSWSVKTKKMSQRKLMVENCPLNKTNSWITHPKIHPSGHRRSAPAATNLHGVVKVACRLHEALEAVRFFGRHGEDQQFL